VDRQLLGRNQYKSKIRKALIGAGCVFHFEKMFIKNIDRISRKMP
jgi:hypothetical protein